MACDIGRYGGDIAVLASMHGKERVIAPLIEHALGFPVQISCGLDTDLFGTFSREIERAGSQLDAARAKIRAAFALAPDMRVALASEGSFGPHPQTPVLPLAHEIVMLVDRRINLEIIGHDASSDTNFAHAIVTTPTDAMRFAEQVGWPGHGVIVMGCEARRPTHAIGLTKNIVCGAGLERAVCMAIKRCGAAFVETDMRAHRNPTRMRAIGRATEDLIRRYQSQCPSCTRPGFDVTERVRGLPCAECDEPTSVTMTEMLTCLGCGHRDARRATTAATADPSRCDQCNP